MRVYVILTNFISLVNFVKFTLDIYIIVYLIRMGNVTISNFFVAY